MKPLLLFILLLVISFVSKAQPPSKFFSTYGGNGYDVGYGVKQTLDNGYIITGSTSSFGQGNTDLYLLKLDSMGQKKFETSFGGSSNEIGKGVVQLSDSGYVMVGYTSSFGIGGYDVFLVKADKTGNLVWKKTIGGSDWDFAYSIQQTTDGGFIIAGTTYSFGYGNADGYVVKTDVNGNIVWSKAYGGKKDDEFKCVVQTADGNYALTGYTKSYSDSLGDSWVFKIDTNGDSLWSKYYGGNKEDFGNGIVQDIFSNLIVSGGSKSNSLGGNSETFIAVYNQLSGNLDYNSIDPSAQEEYYNGSALGLNSNIAHCGITKNTTFGYDGLVDVYHKYYGYLNYFSKGTTAFEEFYAISATKDKGFVTVGKTTGFSSALEDIFFMKMDSSGNFGTSIVGLNEITKSNNALTIFPNPTDKIINVLFENFKDYGGLQYFLLDLNGKRLKFGAITSNTTRIETSDIAPGLYFVQLFGDNNTISFSKISIIRP